MSNMVKTLASMALILTFFPVAEAKQKKKPPPYQYKVSKTARFVKAKVNVPIPEEVENKTQAHALAREAAIVLAQTKLAQYVAKLKVKSGMKVDVAENAYIDLKNEVGSLIRGARVTSTKWKKGRCYVSMVVSRKELKTILKKF